MTVVSYHVEQGGEYYSLAHVYNTLNEAQAACDEYQADYEYEAVEADAIPGTLGIGDYHGKYTVSTVPRGTREGDHSEHGASTVTIVDSILQLFDFIREDQGPEWYKPLEPESIAQAVERVQWRESVGSVGGQIVSRLILSHGLPNANHRTSLTTLLTYLETFGDLPEVPDTNVGDEWVEWINGYIRESKCLITVRRNARLFGYLMSIGATGVERKNNLVIGFEDYPPGVDDPWEHYRTLHEELWTDFTYEFLERCGASELADREDDGMRVLADRL